MSWRCNNCTLNTVLNDQLFVWTAYSIFTHLDPMDTSRPSYWDPSSDNGFNWTRSWDGPTKTVTFTAFTTAQFYQGLSPSRSFYNPPVTVGEAQRDLFANFLAMKDASPGTQFHTFFTSAPNLLTCGSAIRINSFPDGRICAPRTTLQDIVDVGPLLCPKPPISPPLPPFTPLYPPPPRPPTPPPPIYSRRALVHGEESSSTQLWWDDDEQ